MVPLARSGYIMKEEKNITRSEVNIRKRSDKYKMYFKCLAPYCPTYKHRDFLEGKAAICPKCKNEFILLRTHLKKRIPVCLLCSRSPKRHAAIAAQSIMNDLFKEVELPEEERNFELEHEDELRNETNELNSILDGLGLGDEN